jgi:hypothetical protein
MRTLTYCFSLVETLDSKVKLDRMLFEASKKKNTTALVNFQMFFSCSIKIFFVSTAKTITKKNIAKSTKSGVI